MGLKVRFPNVFTINTLGTPGGSIPFPFSITSNEGPNGFYSLSLHPQSVFDLYDILENFEKIVAFEVSTGNYDLQTGQDVGLSEEAAAQQVDFQAIDSDTIVISGNDLCDLLLNLYHYNIHAFDIGDSSSSDYSSLKTYHVKELSNNSCR